MSESWAEVAGSNGWYDVSDMGRVRSWRTCGPADERASTPKLLNPWMGSNGYPMVSLCRGTGRPVKRAVHRLVLESFVGPGVEGTEACHNNGIRGDARLLNLRWGTRSENNLDDKHRHGTALLSGANHQTKLSDQDVTAIRKLYSDGATQKDLAARYSISRQTIGEICARKKRQYVDDGFPPQIRKAGGARV